MNERSCGILLPVYALPSPHGIGTLGAEAFRFVDFLHEANVRWWQILPLGATGYGDSPYQSFSSFAGNPYLIDLDLLEKDGLLTDGEVAAADAGAEDGRVNYAALYENRFPLLQKACDRGWARDREQVEAFCRDRAWLGDYALFMALKRHFGMRPWYEWPADIRLRDEKALARCRELCAPDVRLFTYIQFLFFRQWCALKAYAERKGVGILGDLPIYVAPDSADVWAEPQFFQLDEDRRMKAVAGVPPDAFSADGQLWGNPLYDWDALRKDGYGWWIRRVDGIAGYYDAIRIDHFRGFSEYWSVPKTAESAKDGAWRRGPGIGLVGVLTEWFPQIRFYAEDLGILTPDVRQLLEKSHLPGMKVLSFAFDATEESTYLPHRIPENCICYTGTHDNLPIGAWACSAGPKAVRFACEYLGCGKAALPEAMLRAGMQSRADLFIAQMQDWLLLGEDSRTNTPGAPTGNWQWRMLPGAADASLAKKMARMAKIYGRTPKKTTEG